MSTDKPPLFLLDAGFNADAKVESGGIDSVAYPLAGDLARICFPSFPRGQSIEDLFNDAQKRDDWERIRRLADCLMKGTMAPGAAPPLLWRKAKLLFEVYRALRRNCLLVSVKYLYRHSSPPFSNATCPCLSVEKAP